MTITHHRPRRTARRIPTRRAWLLTAMLVLFLCLNYADKAVLAFGGTQIQADLGISPAQFGVVQSSFFWLFAAGALFFGVLSRAGRAPVAAGPPDADLGRDHGAARRNDDLHGVSSRGSSWGFAEGPSIALATHAVHSWFPADKRALPAGLTTAVCRRHRPPGLCSAPDLDHRHLQLAGRLRRPHRGRNNLGWSLAGALAREPAVDDAAPEAGPVEAEPESSVDVSYWTLLRTPTVAAIVLAALPGLLVVGTEGGLVAGLPLGMDWVTARSPLAAWCCSPYAAAAAGAIAAGWLSNRLVGRGVSLRIARGYLAGGLVATAGICMVGLTLVIRAPCRWRCSRLPSPATSRRTPSRSPPSPTWSLTTSVGRCLVVWSPS